MNILGTRDSFGYPFLFHKKEVIPTTRKQKLFVQEYLIDLNATQAAIRAGYSPESAADIGSENLREY